MQPKANADQTDILADNERLTTELKTAKDSLAEANTNLATVTSDRDGWKTRAEKAESDRAEQLNKRVAAEKERDTFKAENESLKTQMADFNKRLGAELGKHGIRPQAAAHQNEGDRKLTATEKCLAAKGAQ